MNPIVKFLVATLGASWRTTLAGIGEAVAIQALTYALNTEYHDPRVFWSGMGLSIMTVIRGWFSKDKSVSNSPNPLADAQSVATAPVIASAPTATPAGRAVLVANPDAQS